ncbi:hypothetical protein QZH41_014069 [Actinostola sp. cb2023]|nr:hypothetical protein QZH41_014069 [Actinostola sp. cb2023]
MLYPKADLSQFSFGPGSVTLNYKGRGYDVLAWGEKTPHYDPAVEKVLQNALGQSWATSRFPQTFTVNPKALYAIPSSPFHANPPDPAPLLLSMNIQTRSGKKRRSTTLKPRKIARTVSSYRKKSLGLTKAGLGRLNRSIEAYVYCILAAQAQTRTSIVPTDGGKISGGVLETQRVFGVLFEDAVKESISSSIQRFQKVIYDARTRLDLATSPGLWLLPSSLLINADSAHDYNNALKRATPAMTFGINNINTESHKLLPKNVQPMVGTSKTKPTPSKPTSSHPTSSGRTPHPTSSGGTPHPTSSGGTPQPTAHEKNLAAVGLVAAGLGW